MSGHTGRTTKLTAIIAAAIVQAVTLGVPSITAAEYVGVSRNTILDWLKRGEGRHPTRAATEPYVSFAKAVEKAKATDEVRRIGRLEIAARGGAILEEKTVTYPDGRVERTVKYTRPEWTVDAWFLERTYPERWGRRLEVGLRVRIDQAAALVAEDLGLDPVEILTEAEGYLRRLDAGAVAHA